MTKQTPDRNLAMELVRTTEAAAMAASQWVGRGDKEGADGAAVDAMRAVLGTVAMDGIVVIGEGAKDEAPMLYVGEHVGTGDDPKVDIAVDPIDGTRLLSLGMPNAVSVVALAEQVGLPELVAEHVRIEGAANSAGANPAGRGRSGVRGS